MSTSHCSIHDADEPADQFFTFCVECGHVYRTEEELISRFNDGLDELNRDGANRNPYEHVTNSKQIKFCPLCTHDF